MNPTFRAAEDLLGVVEVNPAVLDPEGILADQIISEMALRSFDDARQYHRGLRSLNYLGAYIYDGLGNTTDAVRAIGHVVEQEEVLLRLGPFGREMDTTIRG